MKCGRKFGGRKCFVYRYFDDGGGLLYVGITVNLRSREMRHRRTSKWFALVASTKIEPFKSIYYAQCAERRAVNQERPRFNKQHNKKARAA